MPRNATRVRTHLVSIGELAALLEIDEQTAYRLAEDGIFGAFQSGRVWFIPREAVMRWLRGEMPAQLPTYREPDPAALSLLRQIG